MIDILMATFNGELYIDAQIGSILSQSYKDWTLYISDDGSSDSTPEIIKKYANLDERIIICPSSNKKPVGAALNFLGLLNFSKSQYVCFADQDDIWFDNKLQILLSEIQDYEKLNTANYPILVYGRGYHLYAENTECYISGMTNNNNPKSLNEFLLLNGGIQGCSIIFNHSLLKVAQMYSVKVAMHDHFVSLIAFTFGQVARVDSPLMLYRHHKKNVTMSIGGGFFSKVISHLSGKRFLIEETHFEATKYFFKTFEDHISLNNHLIYSNYIDIPGSLKHQRMLSIIKNNFKVNGSVIYALFKALLWPPLKKDGNINIVDWSSQ
jgi:rhamnosyltransferase